jgi:acyl carrier protein
MTPLSFETVFSDLVRIVADALRVDPTTITPDTNLIVDLNAESIDLVDIRFRIEEAYGFQVEQRAFIAAIAADVPGGDVLEMLTMRRLANFVLRRKSEVA